MLLNSVDTETYSKWKSDSLNKMKQKARSNVYKRTEKIEELVTSISHKINPNLSPFIISSDFQESALNRLFSKFEDWSGVNIKSCKNHIKNWCEYWDRTDNWFNRNKGKWFGDYYFKPIFNIHLKVYCGDNLLLYIKILHQIFHENIRFHQTRPQSLVIDQCLVQSTILQDFLQQFANSYGIFWTLPKPKSATVYRDSWRQCINKIYIKIHNIKQQQQVQVQQQLQLQQQPQSQPIPPQPVYHISNNYNNTYNNITYNNNNHHNQFVTYPIQQQQQQQQRQLSIQQPIQQQQQTQQYLIITNVPSTQTQQNTLYQSLSIPTVQSIPYLTTPVQSKIVKYVIIPPQTQNITTTSSIYRPIHKQSNYVSNHRYHPFSVRTAIANNNNNSNYNIFNNNHNNNANNIVQLPYINYT